MGGIVGEMDVPAVAPDVLVRQVQIVVEALDGVRLDGSGARAHRLPPFVTEVGLDRRRACLGKVPHDALQRVLERIVMHGPRRGLPELRGLDGRH